MKDYSQDNRDFSNDSNTYHLISIIKKNEEELQQLHSEIEILHSNIFKLSKII